MENSSGNAPIITGTDIPASIKERISRIANELKIEKKGENEEVKFTYFNLEDITKVLVPLLHKYKMNMEFDMMYRNDSDMYRGELSLEDFDSDKARSFHFDIPLAELANVTASQSAGATLTYCKRYMIMNVFHIADNSSDLDNSNNHPSGPKLAPIDKIVDKIKASTTPEKLKVWEEWIPVSGYPQPQKDIMLRVIEEVKKK